MLQSERHEKIMEYLSEHTYLTVDNAVELFGASPATARRDFADLAEKDNINRIRGGIKLSRKDILPFELREEFFMREKESIAREAAKLIKERDAIFIDGGTTTAHMGICIPDVHLRIITNSLRFAMMVEKEYPESSRLELYITGGFLYAKSGILLGPNTEKSLMQYRAETAFLSVGGINANGLFNSNELVMTAERVMVNNASKVVILADHSKIGKSSMCRVCGLEKIDVLITDKCAANRKILEQFRTVGIKVIEV